MLIENLNKIKDKINDCVKRNNIDHEIKLIAVSKTKPFEMIEELYNCGHFFFGENRVQDFEEKAKLALEKGYQEIEWHFIGHLQKNKAKHIARYAHVFQCLDSIKLAEKLNKYAKEYDRILEVLVQVNSSDEEQKSGLKVSEVEDFIKNLACYKNLNISGLMSIGKFNEDPEKSRIEFKLMKNLYDNCATINQDNLSFKYLSMGMSNDFTVAVEEGANIVRIGTSIFGKRNY